MGKSAILSVRIVSNGRDAEKSMDRTARKLTSIGKAGAKSGVTLSRMYQKMDGAARTATKVGALAIATQALTVKAAQAASALAPLAGLVGAIPGAAGAAGAAMATFKVATEGVSDALEAAQKGTAEFNDAIKDMPPSMQNSVRSMARLQDEFEGIAKSVQSGFWKDLDRQIDALGRATFPMLNREMTATARGMNGFVTELLEAGRQASTIDAIAASFELAQRAIENLTPAVGPVVDGIAEIVEASADMMGGFEGAEDAGKSFQRWAKRITSDGSLERWFRDGMEAAKELARGVGGIGRILGGIGKAANEAGGPGGGLATFADSMNRIADAIARPEIQDEMVESFRRANEMVGAVTDVLIELLPHIVRWAPELLAIATAWRVATTFMAAYQLLTLVVTGLHAIMAAGGVAALASIAWAWVTTAAAALLNAGKIALAWVIAMGPVGWAIAAVIAVGAAFLIAYEKCGWFRDGVNKAMGKIKSVIGFVVDWIKRAWTGAWEWAKERAVRFVVGAGVALNGIRTKVSGIVDGIKGGFSRAWDSAKSGAERFRRTVSSAMERVKGVIESVRRAASRALDVARDAVSKVNPFSWFAMGAQAPQRQMLPDVGQPFYMTAAIIDSGAPAFSRSGPVRTEQTVVNITVNGAIDPNETARQIRRLLDRDGVRDGRFSLGVSARRA